MLGPSDLCAKCEDVALSYVAGEEVAQLGNGIAAFLMGCARRAYFNDNRNLIRNINENFLTLITG